DDSVDALRWEGEHEFECLLVGGVSQRQGCDPYWELSSGVSMTCRPPPVAEARTRVPSSRTTTFWASATVLSRTRRSGVPEEMSKPARVFVPVEAIQARLRPASQ